MSEQLPEMLPDDLTDEDFDRVISETSPLIRDGLIQHIAMRERQLSLYQRALSIACFTLTGSQPPEAHELKIQELLAMAAKELGR